MRCRSAHDRRTTVVVHAAVRLPLLLAGVAALGCAGAPAGAGSPTLEILAAGSLARPLRAAADSFTSSLGLPQARLELAGSLEAVRRVTELGRRPDLLALADAELMPRLLVPSHASWWADFARNRLVLAYAPGARGAERLAAGDDWRAVVTAPGVVTGRSDPDLDPAGYRTLLAMRLAGRQSGSPGLAGRLLAGSPSSAVRPKSADLVALLQAGELDYAWLYESVARAAGLRFIPLPDSINLGEPALAAAYAAETVRVAGRARGDTLAVAGAPIVFALTVPDGAPHRQVAERFAAWLLGPDGRRVLAREQLILLDSPRLHGRAVPPAVAPAVRTASGHAVATVPGAGAHR